MVDYLANTPRPQAWSASPVGVGTPLNHLP